MFDREFRRTATIRHWRYRARHRATSIHQRAAIVLRLILVLRGVVVLILSVIVVLFIAVACICNGNRVFVPSRIVVVEGFASNAIMVLIQNARITRITSQIGLCFCLRIEVLTIHAASGISMLSLSDGHVLVTST